MPLADAALREPGPPGLELHPFSWLASDALVGALPARWNRLVVTTRRAVRCPVHFALTDLISPGSRTVIRQRLES
jgi:hypothetical protein